MIYSQHFIDVLRKFFPYSSTIVQKAIEGEDINLELNHFIKSSQTDPILAQYLQEMFEQEIYNNLQNNSGTAL